MVTTWKEYNAQGSELEALVERALVKKGATYERHDITAPRGTALYEDQLKKQHMGDFYLVKSKIALECKKDALAEKYGNLFLEIGEIRDGKAPVKKRTIESVGFVKHLTKAPTIFIHQVGNQDRFFVYSAEALYNLAAQGYRSGLIWKEAADWRAGRLDKLNVGLLFKGFNSEPYGTKRAQVFLEVNEDGLTEAIAECYKGMTRPYKKHEISPLKTLVEAYGKGRVYEEKYGSWAHLMGGKPTGEIWEEL